MTADGQVETIDARDEAAFRDWFAVLQAAERHDDGQPGGWTFAEQWATAVAQAGGHDRRHWLVRDAAGAAVGAARLTLTTRDNLWSGGVEIYVRPDGRRRGVGSRLLEAGSTAAAAGGRTTLRLAVERRGVPQAPGDAFATARGFSLVHVEERRDLVLPVDPASLDRLEQAALPHAAGYTLSGWVGDTPPGLLDARARLSERISADAPTGAADIEPESWDAERVWARDRTIVAMDRFCIATAARHDATGELVGVTDITVPREDGEVAWQWDTVVDPAHRGHRLGLLLKIANLRVLEALDLPARRVATWNATTNTFMIRVNETLGATLVARNQVWERALPRS